MTLTHDRRAELLASCPLFRGVGAEDLASLAEVATEVEFPPRQTIVLEGQVGTGFFVIVAGRVRVVRNARTVATLGPGDFFGELSVLDGGPRIAQVVAEEATRCLALASWDFERVLLENAGLSLAILRGLASRLRAVTDSHTH